MSNGVNGTRSFSMINNQIDDSSFKTLKIFDLKLRTKCIYIGKTKNDISFVEIRPDRIVFNNLISQNKSTKYNITLPYVEMTVIRYCFCSNVSAIFIQPIYESFLKLSDWIKNTGANNETHQILKRLIPENFVMINLEAVINRTHLDEFCKAAKNCQPRLRIIEINISLASAYLNQPNKLFQLNQIVSSTSSDDSYNHLKRKKDDKTEEVIDIDDEDEEKHGDNQEQEKSNEKNNILDQAILKYPNDEDIKPIILYGHDLKCLREGQYLNDNIMNFYLKYYQINGQISQEIVDKMYIFDALFATHLLNVNTRKRQFKYIQNSKMVVCSNHDSLENSYHKVLKKWTKDIDIFSKDFLLIPLVINGHWFLIILCYIGNVISNANNSTNSSLMMITRQQNDVAAKRPTLIVMDSLDCKNNRSQILSCIVRYLRLELKEKHLIETSKFEFNFKNISAVVPQQQNSYDCGLFVLEYIERFLKDPEDIYNRLLRDKSALHDWFDSTTLHHKRAKIQQIILNMLLPDDAKNLEYQLTQIQLAEHRRLRNGII
ncbi:uncharacterized protein LOC142646254 [Dermatophagoides pteronyssinus]|uniref:Ubiquitin-like protease family profile domain-containing protein n=1 Tax=Dermatophagoides pteronyssinus TaxID=6956 RepID=A0ABQ8IZU9_DERPT|nr:hypothetical protein DERP_000212 [Dermatophagoides pteronyssinus]